MSLKTENSRRVVKSRPVCMGLYAMQFVSQRVSQFCCGTSCTRNYKVCHASQ
jgi:hypothetical protein